jgi:hypothetical protein
MLESRRSPRCPITYRSIETGHNTTRMGRILLTIAVALSAACSERGSEPAQPSRTTERRAIQLPVRQAATYEDPSCDPAFDALTIRLAREEQLPEGPQSFAVLDDGSLVVADPLHERLVFFTSDGKFQRGLCVEWAVTDVASLGNRQLHIKRAGDPAGRTIDFDGRPLADAKSESVAASLEPEIRSDQSAILRWSARAESGPAETEIELSDPTKRIASVQVIAVDRGKVYVRLESTEAAARSPTRVGVTVRRYSRAGASEAEVSGIPIDYYVVPTTPFRVVNDVLYQLFPTEKDVQIRVWDLP